MTLHIHECPECTEDFDCEDEECYDLRRDMYELEKVCEECKGDG